MSMIEADIEDKIAEKIAEKITDYDIQSSWHFVSDGEVKSENTNGKKGVISIYITPMGHDAFSLPNVTMTGVVSIEAKCESCPTMREVTETFEAIQYLLSFWHYKSDEFSAAFSSDDFFATELILTSGDKVSYDRSNNCWVVTLGFSIRGTQYFNTDLTSD